MAQETEHQPCMSPIAPPTEPGELMVAQGPSSWPKVIGIIAIVLGAGGILLGVYTALSPLLLDFIADFMPPGQEGVFEGVKQHPGAIVAGALVAVLLAVVLMVGGIGLVKRRRGALGTCRAWAVLKMIYAVAWTAVTYQMQHTQMEAMTQQSPGMATMPAGMTTFLLVFGTVVGILWYLAFPVFLLIWLGRRQIKAETATWS